MLLNFLIFGLLLTALIELSAGEFFAIENEKVYCVCMSHEESQTEIK
jgi:hypothetical protein